MWRHEVALNGTECDDKCRKLLLKDLLSVLEMNRSDSESGPHLDAWETLIGWTSFSLITATGLVGNLFVIVAIIGSAPMRRSLMNLLLMNLAIADFCNLISCSVDWVQIVLAGAPVWVLPDALCPIVRYLSEVFLYSSLLLQVGISIERYVATVHPLHVRQICSNFTLIFWVSGIWLVSATFALPHAFTYRVFMTGSVDHPVKRCAPITHYSVAYKTAECLSFYFVPFVLLAVLYWRISRLLWNNTNYLHASIRQSGRTAALAQIRGRRRVVKMLVSCVAVYFICYSPIQFVFVSQVVFGASIVPPFSVIMAMNALCYASSACNPILYTVFSTRFRLRFAQLLCFASPCGQPPSAGQNSLFTRPRSQVSSSIVQCHAANLLISLPTDLRRSSRPLNRKRESQSVVQRNRPPARCSVASSQSDLQICAAHENVKLRLILPIKSPPSLRALDDIRRRDVRNAAEFSQL